MKTVGRLVLILLAITAVASATYALGQTQVVSQIAFAGDGPDGRRIVEGEFEGFGPAFERGDRPEPGAGFGGRDGEHARRGDGSFNLSAVSGFAKTLIPIALVITAVILATKVIDWLRSRARNPQN